MSEESILFRNPSPQEMRLLEFLVQRANLTVDWKALRVCPLDDGGMGSLSLFPKGSVGEDRKVGSVAAEHQFTDVDGVEIIVTLYLDIHGQLYELDVWKTNFAPRVRD